MVHIGTAKIVKVDRNKKLRFNIACRGLDHQSGFPLGGRLVAFRF